MQGLAVVTEQRAEFGITDADCVLQHCPEHRLQLPGRARDDAQHLGGRRLLLQRLAKIVRALAQLVKQTAILDGDDGLGRKVLHQLDLLVGERSNLRTAKVECPNRHTFAQQRHTEYRAVSQPLGEGAPFWKLLRLGLQVEHMDRPALENGPTANAAAYAWHANSDRLRYRAPVRGRAQLLPFELENGDVVRTAEARGAADHDVEHGLKIGRRGADDLQNFGRSGLPFQRLGSLPMCLGKLPPCLVSVVLCLGKLAGAAIELPLQSRD